EFEVRVAVVARLGIRSADGYRGVLAYRHQVAEQDVDLPWPGAVDGTPRVIDVNVRAAPPGGGHARLGEGVEQRTDRVAVENRRHIHKDVDVSRIGEEEGTPGRSPTHRAGDVP